MTADLTYVPTIESTRDFHEARETNQQLTSDVKSSLAWLVRTYWMYRLNSSSGSGILGTGSEMLLPKHQSCTCLLCVSDPLVRDSNTSHLSYFSEMLSTVCKISRSKECSANLKTMPQVGKYLRREWAAKHLPLVSFECFAAYLDTCMCSKACLSLLCLLDESPNPPVP